MLQEVHAVAGLVDEWAIVPTSGSAVCRYTTVTGVATRRYTVNYQSGNIGNLVHELTHVSINERYQLDFVNYPNKGAVGVPDRTLSPKGYCTNEEERQRKQMSGPMNDKTSSLLNGLEVWNVAAVELSVVQRKEIADKLLYGKLRPHLECDTVLNQIRTWLYEWGFPSATVAGAKQPVVNALVEEVEKVVDSLTRQRANGMA
jgi:hypothetical protein